MDSPLPSVTASLPKTGKLRTPLSPDQTAELFTEKLQAKEPFYFIRFGDGALECIYNLGRGRTIDGEQYSPKLGQELLKTWQKVMAGKNIYAGDWIAASFDELRRGEYPDHWEKMVADCHPTWVHPEALLMMRETESLRNFYQAASADPRKKIFLGARANRPAAKVLGAHHVPLPMSPNLLQHVYTLTKALLAADFEVLYYGAGMAGNIAIANVWEKYPERTYVHLGSALDPIGLGKSRRQQLPKDAVERVLAGLL